MIETLSQNPLSLVLIFPVVTLTVFVVGIIRIDLAKFVTEKVGLEDLESSFNRMEKGEVIRSVIML